MNFSNKKNPYFSDEHIFESFHKTAPVSEELDMKKFGERLKYAREKALLTQDELAKILSISKITISNYERGKRKDYTPSIKTIYQIAYILNVSIDWLCGFSEIPNVGSITSEVKKEIYISLLIDIMKTAQCTQKYKKNYYKIPRHGLVYEMKERFDKLDTKYMHREISPNDYRDQKKAIWQETLNMDIETIKLLSFNDKEYIKYISDKAKEKQENEKELDRAEKAGELPF